MKVKINGFVWTVIPFERKNESYDGQTTESKMTIKFNVLQDKQMVRATLVHELCHAFLDSFGFSSYCKTKFTVEELCEFVAMNNDKIKKVADYIMEEISK